eukprot:1623888-Ditylum_brightwellii.AAC.1
MNIAKTRGRLWTFFKNCIAAYPVVHPVWLEGNAVGVAGSGDEEYEHGTGGRKAACHFTQEERGHKKVKYTYCDQKKVWDLVDKMIPSGYTVDSAIDTIYSVYGLLSVTKIIKQIHTDELNGGHPQLN